MAPIELVATILQPVRPRDQHLTSARGAHLVSPIAVDKLTTAGGVRAEPPADLDDYSLLIPGYDLDLLSGWCDHGSPHVRLAAWPDVRTRIPEITFLVSACGQEAVRTGVNLHTRSRTRLPEARAAERGPAPRSPQ